ncbi:SAM-dependent methyltransferase [Naumannella cuiyingiana]|uniref:SAM-dependent methyltransferase n=1 Tax=Naumannella cuiyingiana TaxID=1347891 RepID=A0A7Z0D992_9ACTN|nr:SAM-dependent methyltransferase [Naumannella cuiyingiana]
MLTFDFDRLGVGPGTRAIDIGAGLGRHSFELYRRGAEVIAFDQAVDDLAQVKELFVAMELEGQVPAGATAEVVTGDAAHLPWPDGHFDLVILSEILEHVPGDLAVIREAVRVTRPGGRVAVSVPRAWPERICWALSTEYHTVPGGHVRIYTETELITKLTAAGLRLDGHGGAHALHAPYWWLRAGLGEDHPLARAWHAMLVWDLMKAPWPTRAAERLLDPVLGKSINLYLTRP